METTIVIVLLVVLAAMTATVLFIFRKRVPEQHQKYLKYVWVVLATIFTGGLYLVARKKEEKPQKPTGYEKPIIKLYSPDEKEVADLDSRVENTREEIKEIEEAADKIDVDSGSADPAILAFMDEDG